jgi:hypothetical protein
MPILRSRLLPGLAFVLLATLTGCSLAAAQQGTTTTSSPTTAGSDLEEAGAAYSETTCAFNEAVYAFTDVWFNQDAPLEALNEAAEVNKEASLEAAEALRAAEWPAEVADDVAVVAEHAETRAENLDAVIEATTLEELNELTFDTSEETRAASERVKEALDAPECPSRDTFYANVDTVQLAFTLAGGWCPDGSFELLDYPPATEAGFCEDAFLAMYESATERDEAVGDLTTTLEGESWDLLVGANWIIAVDDPARYAGKLGGEIVDIP